MNWLGLVLLLTGGCSDSGGPAQEHSASDKRPLTVAQTTPGTGYEPWVAVEPSGYHLTRRDRILAGDSSAMFSQGTAIAATALNHITHDFRVVHDMVGPAQKEDLASVAFVWPAIAEHTSATPGYLPLSQEYTSGLPDGMPLHLALDRAPRVYLSFEPAKTVVVAPFLTAAGQVKYRESQWPVANDPSPRYRRPEHVSRRVVNTSALDATSAKVRWSQLNTALAGWAVLEDARLGLAARQLDWAIQLAALTLYRVPASLEELGAASGLAPVNLAPAEPGSAQLEVMTDGVQAFRFTLRFRSGVETESVLFFHPLPQEGEGPKLIINPSWSSLENIEAKAPPRTWQPFAAFDLVPMDVATLPFEVPADE